MKRAVPVLSLLCFLAACTPAQTPASRTVESFLQALSDKDESLMLSHICPDYKFDALLEFDALAQVKTELKDVSCQQADTDGDAVFVTCKGSIVSNYGSELFSYDLTGRIYRVEKEGDDWLVCGYTK